MGKGTMKETKVYVMFHIGRGGRFNAPGHLTFRGEGNFHALLTLESGHSTIISEDEDGVPLADEDWILVDGGGNIVLKGREEIEAETGRLEWDGDYNTDYVKAVDDLNEEEQDIIFHAYCEGKYMSDELKDAICDYLGYSRAHEIKRYPTSLEVFTQKGCITIDIDGRVGESTREDWREELTYEGFDELSIKKIIDKLELCDTNDKAFFYEDN